MTIWIKLNGTELELNDQKGNIEAARKLGWKPKTEAKKEKPIQAVKKEAPKKAK